MRAAVLTHPGGRLEFMDLTVDEPLPHEIVVRPVNVGLCHSDLHYIDGVWSTSLPEVLGHEVAGVVENVGDAVVGVAPGTRVVTCLTSYCGRCRECVSGRLVLCERYAEQRARSRPALLTSDGTSVGRIGGLGGFAERMVVHETAAVPIGDDIPMTVACLMGCAVITGMGAVIHKAKVQPGARVAVIGCGGVGLAVTRAAQLVGAAQVIAVDIDNAALERARGMGATDLVNATERDATDVVKKLSNGGVDHCFEVLGRKRTAEQAIAMVRRGGVATIVGMVPDETPLHVTASELFFGEKVLQGSYMGTNRFPADVPMFEAFYRSGRLSLDDFISGVIPFNEINDGFTALRGGEVARLVLDMNNA